MSFQFAGRIIANPAPAFFSKPTFVSADPELEGATSGRITDRQKALHDVITSPNKQHFAERLAGQNIKYIVLAKELDYEQYDHLNDQTGLRRLHDYHTATVYENQAWRTMQ
jgi:hypothetical protein